MKCGCGAKDPPSHQEYNRSDNPQGYTHLIPNGVSGRYFDGISKWRDGLFRTGIRSLD